MYDFTAAPGVSPSSQSRVSNGVTLSALGAAIVLGTNTGANGYYGQFRFDLTAAGQYEQFMDLRFRVVAATVGSIAIGFDLYAVDYGTVPTLSTADYGVAINNGDLSTGRGYSVKLGTLIPAGAIAEGDVFELSIPARFAQVAGAGLTDLEIRPSVDGVPAAAHTVVLYGPSAADDADKPSLRGVTYTENEQLAENSYREVANGREHFVAIGLESKKGVAVKPNIILPITSGYMDDSSDNIMSGQKTRNRSLSGSMVVGPIAASGSFQMELQPNLWHVMLRSLMKLVSVTDLGGGVYKKVFQVGKAGDLKTFTLTQRKADWSHQVFPGVMMSGLSLQAQFGAIVGMGIDLQGRFPWHYDEPSAGGADMPHILAADAAGDTAPPMSFQGVSLQVTSSSGAVLTGHHIPEFGVSFAQGLEPRVQLDGKRHFGPQMVGGFGATFDFPMYFESEVMLREHLGVDNITDWPYVAGRKVNFHSAEFEFAGAEGSAVQSFKIIVPKFATASYSAPVPADGNIMCNVSAAAFHDSSTEGSVQVEIISTDPESSYEGLTDYIYVQPVGYAFDSLLAS